MKYVSGPYFEPDFDPLLDRFGTPGVVVDNETREDCTLVKVDSVNRDGVLLEMVQLLTDLDLVISKSYISSDGGWLMDVFHVTDQIGRKLTDPSLPEFIQRALVPFHRPGNGPSPKFTTCLGNVVGPGGPDVSDCAALEFTVHYRPGLLSSIISALVDNGCHVASGQAWTHNDRAAGVLYVTATADGATLHPSRWARIERLVNSVVNVTGERHWVCMSEPVQGRVHTERRLHQLMHDDRDYESGPAPTPVDEDLFSMGEKAATARTARRTETRVSIDSWDERGYAVVKMTSRDRPRLLFDTVCALTDMQYVVFHATVGSQGPLAIQEYYIRHKDGRTVDSNVERQKVSRCLVAAVERRTSHGVRVEVRAADRSGLLSDFTRVLREHGLSLLRIELKNKDEAIGIFYLVTDTGGEVRAEAVRAVQGRVQEMDISLDVVKEAPGWPPVRKTSVPAPPVAGQAQERPRPSLGSLLWSHLGKLSTNFSYIGS
ncbi:ACT domain-containing protein ACR3-like [Phragmites australis]|uniref:ACT domain-containing protein ACR3-like n=1 Tax=Phragmites australis TaxID=29695 RepID=UPI002D798EE6|nr:ACT domain-containing protein ACR3-like [Phragmites australis]XP_062212293.1 ACT domain-containing protein ACR3-like [Phragmites australis]XP_062212294.1 ACT domain-containing protein ACR3-like [Phragmites australis]